MGTKSSEREREGVRKKNTPPGLSLAAIVKSRDRYCIETRKNKVVVL